MGTANPDMRAVLRGNLGFEREDVERWIDFARAAGFRPHAAVPVNVCPDCGRGPKRVLGRYIFFSTLVQLLECPCGLIWANARIDAASSAEHFDSAYSDEAYYERSRSTIFAHLAGLIAEKTPRGGSVLDIGGAGGQLAAVVHARRPDLAITVQDISAAKIAQARSRGFEGLVGGARALAEHGCVYDTIILADSMYYEPDLPTLWEALRTTRRESGRILIRVPNRVPLLRLVSTWQSWSRALPTTLYAHNPDHLVVCTPRYLTGRLTRAGCRKITWLPTPIGEGPQHAAIYQFAAAFHAVTGRCITPSVVAVAEW
jgi:SAM-dependent methyltransferase